MEQNKRERASDIAMSELEKMFPLFITTNGIVLVICIFYTIFGEGDLTLYSGLAAGNAVVMLNFLLTGVFIDRSVASKINTKARFAANMYYGMRFAGLFVIFAILLALRCVNFITALFPLFLPKTYYLLTAKNMKIE